MGVNRREFLKRMTAFVLLGGAAAGGFWETLQRQLNQGNGQKGVSTLPLLTGSNTTDSGTSSTSQGAPSSVTSTSTSTTPDSQSRQSTQSSSSVTGSTSASSSTSSSQTVPSGYVLLAPLSALSGRTSAFFTHPNYGLSLLLYYNGQWKAFNASCTHAGCTVQFTGSSVYCPCHAGYFSASNGSVQSGPPPSALAEYAVLVQNSNLYVGLARVN